MNDGYGWCYVLRAALASDGASGYGNDKVVVVVLDVHTLLQMVLVLKVVLEVELEEARSQKLEVLPWKQKQMSRWCNQWELYAYVYPQF